MLSWVASVKCWMNLVRVSRRYSRFCRKKRKEEEKYFTEFILGKGDCCATSRNRFEPSEGGVAGLGLWHGSEEGARHRWHSKHSPWHSS